MSIINFFIINYWATASKELVLASESKTNFKEATFNFRNCNSWRETSKLK